MTANANKPTKESKEYIAYSAWSKEVLDKISSLCDECLDRFKYDKKLNTAILKTLSKLKDIVEKQYYKQ